MMERRFDPTLREWRTYTAAPAAADDGRCRFCPTRDPAEPTDVPAEAYQLAVLDDPFPAMAPGHPTTAGAGEGIYRSAPSIGASEVVLYSDQHGHGLANLPDTHVARLMDVWADRYAVLGARDEIAYVFIFEDGAAPGATGAHPYGQVHAYPEIPPLMLRELHAGRAHLRERDTCLFCDVVAHERDDPRRTVVRNGSFLAFVPFAARFPYELHIYPQRHIASLLDCTDPDRLALARILQQAVRAYQRLFEAPAPYVLAVHQAPTDDGEWLAVSHLHLELTPLSQLAAAQVGAGSFIGDRLPEDAAADLRAALSRVDGAAPAAVRRGRRAPR